jgi:hypothetical protein|tara:strand:- start:2623 stop:2874 length:252 start_codon:yes stop_codon:yes gene_type:complete
LNKILPELLTPGLSKPLSEEKNMSFRGTGYHDWRMAHNPRDDYDNDAVMERIKEQVEDDNPDWTEERVKREVKRRFEENDYED